MQPNQRIDSTTTPDGQAITLTIEGGYYIIRVARDSLMSSAMHGSEEILAELGCAPLQGRKNARVLVGGLGMGYTARAALDQLPADAEVVVSEFLPAVVRWNRGPLGPLADHPLDDPRTTLIEGDAVELIKKSKKDFDALLLDFDNGPGVVTSKGNAWIYGNKGLAALREALRPGGMLVIWSAFRSPPFEKRMERAGFDCSSVFARARGKIGKGPRHTLYVGKVKEGFVPSENWGPPRGGGARRGSRRGSRRGGRGSRRY